MIWSILGASVAVIALFCIVVAETLVGKPFFEQHRTYFALAIVIPGIILWFAGRHSARRRDITGLGLPQEESKQFVLFDLRYWGPMLVILGIITLLIRPLRERPTEAVPVSSPPRSPPPVVAMETSALSQPKPVVVFPKLKLGALFYRPGRSQVIINGESYCVGDKVSNATVIAIDGFGATLELQGEIRRLTLR